MICKQKIGHKILYSLSLKPLFLEQFLQIESLFQKELGFEYTPKATDN